MANEGPKSKRERMAASKVFAQVCPETQDTLERLCRAKSYRADQIVTHAQEETDFVGCVLSGILRMQKTLADGRQHLVGLLVEGDIFGRSFNGEAEFSIEAATDAEICTFQRTAFETLLTQSPTLEHAVLLNMADELDRAREWIIILSNRKITGRIAGFLLLLCSRFRNIDHIVQPDPEGIEIKIPISRIDLAHLLGTRPESISRALHTLGDQGHIDIIAPDRIRLRNLEALAEAADEDEFDTIAGLRDFLPNHHPKR